MTEQRITTTEREAIMQALYDGKNPPVEWPRECADVVLAMIAAERVRVVEGLVAAIKARTRYGVVLADDGEEYLSPDHVGEWVRFADVLEKVEAAREDTP